ncbi:hypothetical protein [Paenibacillus gallinarum]|uniref:Uncharacterized protein n=1 Tax=Paenibacillus gallinarum TaxID=2762232 RepID=A0ABR8T3C4_9BACL|nr:hypothetical protein [Paenibacillus gallinarum]MBD7970280.1 hypothetical protein [Paenibacillus gallinarum]
MKIRSVHFESIAKEFARKLYPLLTKDAKSKMFNEDGELVESFLIFNEYGDLFDKLIKPLTFKTYMGVTEQGKQHLVRTYGIDRDVHSLFIMMQIIEWILEDTHKNTISQQQLEQEKVQIAEGSNEPLQPSDVINMTRIAAQNILNSMSPADKSEMFDEKSGTQITSIEHTKWNALLNLKYMIKIKNAYAHMGLTEYREMMDIIPTDYNIEHHSIQDTVVQMTNWFLQDLHVGSLLTYKCMVCGTMIPEDYGYTANDGSWVCGDSCGPLEDDKDRNRQSLLKEVG